MMDFHTLAIVVSAVVGTLVGAILGLRSAIKNWEPK
jgi:uncharacterized membrane protein YqgA involved in biofilm formation